LNSVIIAIDDKEKNVISILEAAKNISPNINIIGFHYKGIEFIPKGNTDIKIFEKNWLIFLETHK